MRNWGEHVYQTDLDPEILYETVTVAYELVEFLMKNSSLEVPKELQPFMNQFLDIIKKDLLEYSYDEDAEIEEKI